MKKKEDFGKSAVISPCEKYRYVLKRRIPQPVRWVKKVVFIMLNPSTADHTIDDPTIRRCISFAESWGCTELSVVNLYAYRATDPIDLKTLSAIEAKGPENLNYQLEEINSANLIIAAWGKHGGALGTPEIRNIIAFTEVKCLGKNKDGSPKHPLYIKSDKELEIYKTAHYDAGEKHAN